MNGRDKNDEKRRETKRENNKEREIYRENDIEKVRS